jgi:hypothetical protein
VQMTQYLIGKKKWVEHCHMCHNVDKSKPMSETKAGVFFTALKPCAEYSGCIDKFKHHITGEDTDKFFPDRKKKRSKRRVKRCRCKSRR